MLCIQFSFLLRLKGSIKEMDEEKEELVTLRLEMGSNNVNNTLKKFGYAQFVRHRGQQDN
jgi:hypothetical protein